MVSSVLPGAEFSSRWVALQLPLLNQPVEKQWLLGKNIFRIKKIARMITSYEIEAVQHCSADAPTLTCYLEETAL
jgi:hypothetical protein